MWFLSVNHPQRVDRPEPDLQFFIAQLVDGPVERFGDMTSLCKLGLSQRDISLPIRGMAPPRGDYQRDYSTDYETVIPDGLANFEHAPAAY